MPNSPQNTNDSNSAVSFHDILEANAHKDEINETNLSSQSSILTQKAMFLLGLADKYKQNDYEGEGVDTSDIKDELLDPALLSGLSPTSKEKTELLTKQLEKDAKKCLSYAMSLRQHISTMANPTDNDSNPQSDPQTQGDIQELMTKINQFTKKVSSKYDRFGSQLVVKGKSILSETIKSEEADKFIQTGKQVIDHWIERRKQRQEGLKEHPGDNEPLSELDHHLDSLLSKKGDDVIDFLSDLRCNAISLLNTIHKHKQTLLKAAKELEEIIGDDEEIRQLIEKGRRKLADGEENRDSLSHTDEALQKLSSKSEKLLDKLHSSQFGQKLLEKGSSLLTTLDEEDKLNPETLYLKAKQLQEDPEYRQQLITRIKDGLLSFLLEYLPQMEIEPLEHDDENSSYSIRNISLKEFIIRSQDIDVTLIPHGVLITARNLLFKMTDVEWSYTSKSFPYPYGSGKIDGLADDVRLAIKLRVEVEEFSIDSIELSPSSTPSSTTPVKTSSTPLLSQTSTQSPTLSTPTSTPKLAPKSSPTDTNSRKSTSTKTSSPSQSPQTPSIEASPSSSPLEQPDDLIQKGSPADPNKKVTKGKSKTWQVVNALNTAFHYRYKLALYPVGSKPYLELVSLSLTIKDTWFGQLATFLLTLFNRPVKHYIQKSINDLIQRKSGVLLEKINHLISGFLPILAKVSDKVQDKSDEVEGVIRSAARQIKQDVITERHNLKARGSDELNLPPSEELLQTNSSPDTPKDQLSPIERDDQKETLSGN